MATQLSYSGNVNHLKTVLCSKIALGNLNKAREREYSMLRPKQFQCIEAILSKDVLGVLPTGYGKSLIFEILPFLDKARQMVFEGEAVDTAVLIE